MSNPGGAADDAKVAEVAQRAQEVEAADPRRDRRMDPAPDAFQSLQNVLRSHDKTSAAQRGTPDNIQSLQNVVRPHDKTSATQRLNPRKNRNRVWRGSATPARWPVEPKESALGSADASVWQTWSVGGQPLSRSADECGAGAWPRVQRPG